MSIFATGDQNERSEMGFSSLIFLMRGGKKKSGVILSFYITREKTAASANFSYIFPVILLLCHALNALLPETVGGQMAFVGALLSLYVIIFICVINGFCQWNLNLRQCSSGTL